MIVQFKIFKGDVFGGAEMSSVPRVGEFICGTGELGAQFKKKTGYDTFEVKVVSYDIHSESEPYAILSLVGL